MQDLGLLGAGDGVLVVEDEAGNSGHAEPVRFRVLTVDVRAVLVAREVVVKLLANFMLI